MRIAKGNIQSLSELLKKELDSGNTWVSYDNKPYPSASLHFFKSEWDVKEFCRTATNSEDSEQYFLRPIKELYETVLKVSKDDAKADILDGHYLIGFPVDMDLPAIVVKGIYLPDLKRIIDDTQWREYKDMGLDWDNRHLSKWWELNGSYRVDHIDRDLAILWDDERTKHFVERLIDYSSLRYVDRSLFISNETKANIASQLSDYPFIELNDPKRREEIIESLGRGEQTWLTLSKQFYPAPEISQYVIAEHLYPKGMVYEQGHDVAKLHSFPEFSMALDYLEAYAPIYLQKSRDRVGELMLIGQYRNQELKFTYEGFPENHTGLYIAAAWENGNKEREIIFLRNPNTGILLKESFFVSLNNDGKLLFNDGVFDRSPDLNFWRTSYPHLPGTFFINDEQLRIPLGKPLEKVDELNILAFCLGFANLRKELELNVRDGKDRFQISVDQDFAEDKMRYELHFVKEQNGSYSFEKYDASFQKGILIEDVTINGINLKELESRMSKVDWNNDIDAFREQNQFRNISSILTDLSNLDSKNNFLLKAKFWTDKPFGQDKIEKEAFDKLKKYNNYTITIKISGRSSITAGQSYTLLKERAVFTEALIKNYSNLNYNTMNQENCNFLKNQVKFMGHGEEHDAAIEQNIRDGKTKFEIKGITEYTSPNRKLESVLHFNRGNENEMYFWNLHDATLKKADGTETSQRFYINTVRRENEETGRMEVKTVGFTKKESANLLDSDNEGNSRSVFKTYYKRDGNTYEGWKKLDLNNVDDKGNHPVISYPKYDLESLIKAHPILEAGTEEKLKELMQSLYRGNEQAVTYVEDENNVRRFLAADPVSKGAFMYDERHKLIEHIKPEVKVKEVKMRPNKVEQPSEGKAPADQNVSQPGTDQSESKGMKQKEKRDKEIGVDDEVPLLAKSKKGKKNELETEGVGRKAPARSSKKENGDELMAKNEVSKGRSRGI